MAKDVFSDKLNVSKSSIQIAMLVICNTINHICMGALRSIFALHLGKLSWCPLPFWSRNLDLFMKTLQKRHYNRITVFECKF